MSITFYADGAPEHLEVNLANRNATLVLAELGYATDDNGCFSAPTTEFLAVCRSWLARNLDRPSLEMPTVELSPSWVDCGRPEGYLNNTVRRLVALAQAAREAGMARVEGH